MTTTVARALALQDARLETLENVVVETLRDATGYRALALVALEQLHALTQTLNRQRETIAELRAEVRRYTGAAVTGSRAA